MKDFLNPAPKTDWKTSNTCYFYEPWTENIIAGKIASFRELDGKQVVCINMTDQPGVTERFPEHLFETYDEAIATLTQIKNDKCAAYKAEITDIESLVRFGFNHNVHQCEEYTDWEAREAYKARAKDLLGIDL